MLAAAAGNANSGENGIYSTELGLLVGSELGLSWLQNEFQLYLALSWHFSWKPTQNSYFHGIFGIISNNKMKQVKWEIL